MAPIYLQAPCTALATYVAMSFDVWYGGGSGKQRMEEGAFRSLRKLRKQLCGGEHFFFPVLIRDLSDKYKRVTWQDSIEWHKTNVLHHNLTQCFLILEG